MINSLQVWRGFAALAVAIYHTYLIIYQKTNVEIFKQVAIFGYLGVPFFFVLSGFIILKAHSKEIGTPNRASIYLQKRFTRVYPIYWICSTAYILGALVGLGDPDFSWKFWNIVEAYALVDFIPGSESPPLKVAWTLFYEVQFYFIFVLLILSRSIGQLALAAWVVAIVLGSAVLGVQSIITSYWNAAFFFGMGAFYLSERVSSSRWPWLMLLGGGILCAVFSRVPVLAIRDSNSPLIVPVCLGFSLLIAASVLFEKRRGGGSRSIFTALGDASYAIYLVHSAAISVVVIVLKRSGLFHQIPASGTFALVLTAAVAAGFVVHWLVERPLLSLLTRKPIAQRAATPELKPAS